MDSSNLMKKVGYVILGTFAAFNVLTLVLMGKMFPEFGPEIAGPYSIMASKGFFIAYHVWGIAIALICMYSLWKNQRGLFMISLLLMMILMFYPYFSSEPSGKKTPTKEISKDTTTRPAPRGDTISMPADSN